ncbi:prephenate dehydratase [Ulvibacter antarcticus]|uniref:prephenate dehydratase n=1 Tax=Ulvibacter antarcticus TaxID=442714 RepID=A0A3L9YA00_9FLAO|nr:prephenate dehydratase domain-containing protein [Ulvibacter antarcticus]RMA57204.1 prephenate dehydratase [Ulvibacter antarcticus]
MKIAIQGIESSFHDMATRLLFPDTDVELVMCDTFEQVTESIENYSADFGVLAIENTIAGSILPNYNLIDASGLVIYDEVFLNIQMYIMALEGQSIYDIEEVHSHPVALLQCKDYLRKLPPQLKIIEGKDTASEAKAIKEQNLKGVAAIAGKQVAEKFGLKILDSNIQNMSDNQTRFVLIGKEVRVPDENVNKATLKFELEHSAGSLSNILQCFAAFSINLTKIQSLPIVGKPWQYAFFVDVLFEDYSRFAEVVDLLKKTVTELKILGVYKHNVENEPSTIIKETVDGKQ